MSSLQPSNLRSLLYAAASAVAALSITACSGGSPSSSAIPAAFVPSTLSRTAALSPTAKSAFKFVTLDDNADPTFNQLLGINDHGVISGYFGIGSASHPNKGYTLVKPYGQNDYTNENFPGSVQTQVTAINDRGDTAGFWVDNKGIQRGFVEWNSVFTSYRDPKTGKGTVNQILGLNDKGIAVGFYTDGAGVNHGFMLNQATGKFTALNPPGGGSVTASGINSQGDVSGFITTIGSNPQTSGFLWKGHQFSALTFPGGHNTQPLGVNDKDKMVGSYDDASGVLHGFVLYTPLTHAKWVSVDDPNGVGSTVVNGLNNNNILVGFYTDMYGNTNGMLVQP